MVAMIDWVTAKVACDYRGAITGGQVLMIDADGTIDWSKDRWREVQGSYSSKMMVQGTDNPLEGGCRLYISGNPTKFLQGHNLFGSNDINYLVARTMEVIVDRLGLPASDNDRDSWELGMFLLSRVDVTRMYDVGKPERVKDWLTSASQVVHSRYQSAGNEHGTSLYVGKNSRRVTLKFYDKLSELQARGHSLPDSLPIDWYHRLMEFASGKLRVEATFRSMWLKQYGMNLGLAWGSRYAHNLPEKLRRFDNPGVVAERLLDERLEGLEMNDTMRLTDEYVGELPGKLALVYEAWRNGRDLRGMYSRRHFYRLRAELLPYGIDIAHTRPREVVAENQYLMGAPLKSFLQGDGVPVPEWAIGTPMYAA